MKVHKIPCDSEFHAYALIRQIFEDLPDECIRTKLRVAGNLVYFHLII